MWGCRRCLGWPVYGRGCWLVRACFLWWLRGVAWHDVVCSKVRVALLGEGGREQALLHEARVVFVLLLVWVLFGGRLGSNLSSITKLGCEWCVGRSTVVRWAGLRVLGDPAWLRWLRRSCRSSTKDGRGWWGPVVAAAGWLFTGRVASGSWSSLCLSVSLSLCLSVSLSLSLSLSLCLSACVSAFVLQYLKSAYTHASVWHPPGSKQTLWHVCLCVCTHALLFEKEST